MGCLFHILNEEFMIGYICSGRFIWPQMDVDEICVGRERELHTVVHVRTQGM